MALVEGCAGPLRACPSLANGCQFAALHTLMPHFKVNVKQVGWHLALKLVGLARTINEDNKPLTSRLLSSLLCCSPERLVHR